MVVCLYHVVVKENEVVDHMPSMDLELSHCQVSTYPVMMSDFDVLERKTQALRQVNRLLCWSVHCCLFLAQLLSLATRCKQLCSHSFTDSSIMH